MSPPIITQHHTYNTTPKPQRHQRIKIGGPFIQKNTTEIDFCASGLHRINKLHNTKCSYLMVISKSYFFA